MEDFRLVQQTVVVACTLAKLRCIVARITGNNTVYQGAVNSARLFEPDTESVGQFPKVDILADTLFQVLAVLENELAREDDEAFVGCSLKMLVAVIQKLRKLAGIGTCRLVVEFAGGIEGYTCFGGIGDNETYLGLFRKFQVLIELGVRVEAAGDNVDQVHAVYRLAVQQALQIQVIQAVLLVEPFNHALFDRLHNHHGTVEIGLLVSFPDNPLDKGPEEVAFSELDNFFGVSLRLGGGSSV